MKNFTKIILDKTKYPSLLPENEKGDYLKEYVLKNNSILLSKPVSGLHLSLNLVPENDSENKIFDVHLFGVDGQYYKRRFHVFRQYDEIPYILFREFGEEHDLTNVLINRIGFSTDAENLSLSYNLKELE